jgi:glycosyltransferase involved in cell wall biosynthesis
MMISPRFFPIVGGGENQARSVAGMLSRAGHSVTVVASRTHNSPWAELMDGFTLLRVPSFQCRDLRGYRALMEQALFLVTAGLVLLWKVRSFDILFFFWGIDYFAFLAGPMRLLGKRSVIRTASTFSREIGNLRDAHGAWVRLKIIRVFDAFLALTSEIEDRFILEGVPSDRIVRIRNAVDRERFVPAGQEERRALRSGLGLEARQRVIVFCGHLTEVKGIDFLMRSLEGLTVRVEHADLVILGSGAYAMDTLESWVRQSAQRVSEKIPVHLAGQVPDAAPYFRCADVFVLPSRSEGMPNVLLEAMAAGLACVATDVGGVPDIVENGVDGVIVSYGDERALREAIVALVGDARRRRILGANARKKVLSGFDSEVLVRQYEDLFARVRTRS